tara:strand:- start:113 stop:307 length:195 start_codon:yes stop_codon:yes gene_type:complete
MSKYKDMMIEVEQYIGELIEDYTWNQIIRQVREKYGEQWVEFVEDKKEEYLDVAYPLKKVKEAS